MFSPFTFYLIINSVTDESVILLFASKLSHMLFLSVFFSLLFFFGGGLMGYFHLPFCFLCWLLYFELVLYHLIYGAPIRTVLGRDLQRNQASFYCASQILPLLQIEGLWQPRVKQVYWCHFANSICSLPISVSHFGNNLLMFKTSSSLW